MVYTLIAIGLMIGLFIWSMCRIGARYDEHFERLDQRKQDSGQRDLTGTGEWCTPRQAAPGSTSAAEITVETNTRDHYPTQR